MQSLQQKIYGGIRRLKYHLAQINGFDLDACDKTTPKIMHIANQSIIDIANKRDEKEAHINELTSTNNEKSGSMGGPQSHSSSTQSTSS